MSPPFIGILGIQSWWEVPCIAHFCSLFSTIFHLPVFDIEELEEALLANGTENIIGQSNTLLTRLIVRLLQGTRVSWKHIVTTSNYQMFLRRTFRNRNQESNLENLFDSDENFENLPLRNKIEILYNLCDFRLDAKDVEPKLIDIESDSLRVEPLGYDKNNSAYWYFYGTRLYREDFIPTSDQKDCEELENTTSRLWQVICFDEKDWTKLTLKFKNSTNLQERALFDVLDEHYLPKIPKLFKERDEQRRRYLKRHRPRHFYFKSKKNKETEIEEEIRCETIDENSSILRSTSVSPKIFSSKIIKEIVHESILEEIIKLDSSRKSRVHSDNKKENKKKTSATTSKNGGTTTNSNQIINDLNSSSDDGKNSKTVNLSKMTPTATTTATPTATNSKVTGRQTNNSLSSLTGNIFIQPAAKSPKTVEVTTPPRKKKVKTTDVFSPKLIPTLSFMEDDEVLQIGMHKVLEYVKNHKDAWPFMDPVEEDIAPRYYSIIRRPMDLLKIEEKLDNGEYSKFLHFRNDFKLIVNNCRLYNGQENEYTQMVNSLQNAFERGSKKYFEQNSSDEEASLEYPEAKTNVFREKGGSVCKLNLKGENDDDNDDDLNDDSSSVKINVKTRDKDFGKSKGKEIEIGKGREMEKSKGREMEKSKGKVIEKDLKSKSISKKSNQEIVSKEKPKELEKISKGAKRKRKDREKKRKKKKNGKSDDYSFDDEISDLSDFDEPMKSPTPPPPPPPKTDKHKKKSENSDDRPKVHPKTSEKIKTKKYKKESELKGTTDEISKKSSKKLIKTELTTKNLKKLKQNDHESSDDDTKSIFSSDRSIIDYPIKSKKKKDHQITKIDQKSKKIKKESKKLPTKLKKKSKIVEKDDDSISSLSRSSSPINNKNNKNSKSKSNEKHEDLFSVSSRSNSREPSPVPSFKELETNDDKIIERSVTPEIKDKYDLIKQRRRGGNNVSDESKWKQIVTEANKIKEANQTKKITASTNLQTKSEKDKNAKLKETIQKLKMRNEKTDSRSYMSNSKESSNEKIKSTKHKSKDEYEFIDEMDGGKKLKTEVASPKEKKKKEPKKSSKVPTIIPTQADEKMKEKPSTNKTKNSDKANVEALDLEAEQTLKDINKWLEYTPRFSEYGSASNSPSRYILDDMDAVTSKLDPNDFSRPVPLQTPAKSIPTTTTAMKPPETLTVTATTTSLTSVNQSKDVLNNFNKQTSQAPGNSTAANVTPVTGGVVPPKRELKELKRKIPKEKNIVGPRKREHQRTTDRLQPGKTKGNLLSSLQNSNKTDELFALGGMAKIKEVKNSLTVKQDENGPKLSLGTVLNTEGFGIVQQHNFIDKSEMDEFKISEAIQSTPLEMDEDIIDEKIDDISEPVDKPIISDDPIDDVKTELPEKIVEKPTPNLNAWFKAFGAPKTQQKPKKPDEEEIPVSTNSDNEPRVHSNEPTTTGLPTQRQRKGSTGSTISERSSFSQDPDSPHLGIDERLGYPSPSPVSNSLQASPKIDDPTQKIPPYDCPIKVGFYKDTTTKSSPEKSCSPKDLPSPYPQYSPHVYSASPPPAATTTSNVSPTIAQQTRDDFGNYSYQPSLEQQQQQQTDYRKTNYYDEPKLPLTNSPYPNYSQQNSPYQQQQSPQFHSQTPTPHSQPHSPYSSQEQNSPYNKPNSPYQEPGINMHPISPHSPFSHSNHSSPYSQQDPNSPYPQKAELSPFHSNTISPKPMNNLVNKQSEPIITDWNQSQNNEIPAIHESQQQQQQPQEIPNMNIPPQISPQIPQQQVPQHVPLQVPQHVPQQIQQQIVPQHMPQQVPQHLPQQVPQHIPQQVPQHVPQQVPQQIPQQAPHQIPNETNKNGTGVMQNLNDNIFSHHLQNYGAPYTSGSQLEKQLAASHLMRQQTMYNQSNLNHCQVNSFDDPHNSQNKTINHMNSSGNYVEGLKHPSVDSNKYLDPSAGFNKQQMFEQMLFGGVNYGKGPPHHGIPGKSSLDISTSKAFDVYSRAATMATQAKNHSLMTSVASSNKNQLNYNETNNSDLVVDKSMQDILNMTYQNTCMKGTTKPQQQLNKPLSLTNPVGYNNQNFDFSTNSQSKSKETQRYEIEQQQKLQQQQQQTQQQQQQQQHQQHQQQMGVNLTNPAFNNPATMEPSLRNLLYPTDERLLNLQGSYYDKSMSPQMFSKNLQHQSQMFGPPMTNYTNSREQQNLSTNFQSQLNKQQNLINVPEVPAPQPPVKIERRGRKKKNANLVVPPAASVVVQQPPPQNQQGFQSYFKNQSSSSASGDSTSISLKTPNVVPGSAFNLGPTPPIGIYGENPGGYLDEFRGTPNHYYIPPGRGSSDTSTDKSGNNSGTSSTSSASPYHQFLPHPPRSPYSFMNHPPGIDPNSPLYQHLSLQRQEDLRAQVLLNQSILGATPPGGYPHPGYNAALTMHKHYDAMNSITRPPWF